MFSGIVAGEGTVVLIRITFVLALGISCANAFADILIDSFTSGPTSLSGSSASQTQPNLADVLGGVRTIRWMGTAPRGGTPPPGSTMRMSVDTSDGGSFTYDGGDYITAANFELLYNAGRSNPPAMEVDLSQTPLLAIDFAHADFAPGYGHFDIRLSSWSGGQYGNRYSYTRMDNSATPFTLLLPLTGPNGPYTDTLDIHHVAEISIGSGNGNLPGSFEITSIRAVVPEPTGVAGALGVAGLLLRRARMFPPS